MQVCNIVQALRCTHHHCDVCMFVYFLSSTNNKTRRPKETTENRISFRSDFFAEISHDPLLLPPPEHQCLYSLTQSLWILMSIMVDRI